MKSAIIGAVVGVVATYFVYSGLPASSTTGLTWSLITTGVASLISAFAGYVAGARARRRQL